MLKMNQESKRFSQLVTLLLTFLISGCGSPESEPLTGGYSLMRLDGRAVIVAPNKRIPINGNVQYFGSGGDYVYGFSIQKEWPPKATVGYFILDTKSKNILEGLSEEKFYQVLTEEGVEVHLRPSY